LAALYRAGGVIPDDLIPQAHGREVPQRLTGVPALRRPDVRLRVADDVRLAPVPAKSYERIILVAAHEPKLCEINALV
jgi:hypothetical protein